MAVAAVAVLLTVSGRAADVLQVSVSIPPMVSLVHQVGGDHVRVTSFMSDNDDPHTFSPTPRAVTRLGECELFVTVGVDFEAAITDKVTRMFPDLVMVDGAAGVDIHITEGRLVDPHIWLSIPNLKQIAANVRRALVTARPAAAADIAHRADALVATYEKAHAELAAGLRAHRGTTFYVYHPAFGYFARDYGLKQASVEIEGKSPSPRQLLGLIKRARRENVKVIFVQPQFSTRPARILADRIDGRVVPLDPLSPDPVGALQQAAAAISAWDH